MTMTDDTKQLPAIPAVDPASNKPQPKRQTGLELKPESPWATRIRKLLLSTEEGPHYLPYMPVKGFRLVRVLRKLASRGSGRQG